MPLTKKGKKIMSAMTSQYGAKKGKQVFYASRNAGKIKGVDPESRQKRVDTNPGGEYAAASSCLYDTKNGRRVTKAPHGVC
jgi:hypothetical protein